MPYEYRRMTPQERQDIVDYRRERGYPLHAPPHPIREAGWYLITVANFEHRSIMHRPDRRDEFEALLLAGFHDAQVEVGGWAILPNHYHILAGADSLNEISSILKQLHGLTSRAWNLADQSIGRRVWYKFADRWMRDERHYFQALNYIHINPVKHGHANEPYDWVWSSVHLYCETKGRDWLRAAWHNNPIPDGFGHGWDG